MISVRWSLYKLCHGVEGDGHVHKLNQVDSLLPSNAKLNI